MDKVERAKKAKKLQNFIDNPALAHLDELQEVNENLEGIRDGIKDVKIELNYPEDIGRKLVSVLVETLHGEKGEKGDTGTPFTFEDLTESQIEAITGPQGEKGERGEPGQAGTDGRDGIDGIDGRDGKDGVDGKDGSPDTPEQVRDKLQSLAKENRLDASAIKGLENTVDRATMDRAISILDQRTQSLVNKFSLNTYIIGVNTAKMTVSATAPSNPATGDTWIDTS